MRKLLLALAVLVSSPAFSADLTVPELLQKHLKAVGPIEQLKSRRMHMRLQGPFEAAVLSEAKRPNLIRKEVSLMGQQQITAFDGADAWKIDPFVPNGATPAALPADEARALMEEADFDGLLVNAAAKGTRLSYAGASELDGKKVHALKATLKNNDTTTVYLDGATFLEVKRSQTRQIKGTAVAMDILSSDYQRVGALQIPKKIVLVIQGMPSNMTILIDKVEQNVALAPSRFARPAP